MLLRHGQVQKQGERTTDSDELSEKGINQAKNIRSLIEEFNPGRIITSSLKRAEQTAEIVNERLKKHIEVNNFVRELIVDKLNRKNNKSVTEIYNAEETNKGYINRSSGFPDGETYENLIERANIFWKELTATVKDNEEQKVLVVSHARFINYLVAVALDIEPDGLFLKIRHCGFVVLRATKHFRTQIVF